MTGRLTSSRNLRDTTSEPAYRRAYSALVRTAYLITGSSQAAEDIVHDVFLGTWGRLGDIQEPDRYLRKAVVNRCRSYTRKSARSVPKSTPEVIEPTSGPNVNRVAVLEALGSLTNQQRIAIVLRFFDDLRYQDIANVLSCREATARSHVKRGLSTLRRELE